MATDIQELLEQSYIEEQQALKELLDVLKAAFGEYKDKSFDAPSGIKYLRLVWPEFEIHQPYWYRELHYRPCKALRKLSCRDSVLFSWRCSTEAAVDTADPLKAVEIISKTHSKTLKLFKKAKKYLKKVKKA